MTVSFSWHTTQIIVLLLIASFGETISIRFSNGKQHWRLGHRRLSISLPSGITERTVFPVSSISKAPEQFNWRPVLASGRGDQTALADSSIGREARKSDKRQHRHILNLYRPQTIYSRPQDLFNSTTTAVLQAVESNPWLQRYAPFYYPQNPQPQQAHRRTSQPEPVLRHVIIGDQVMVPPKVEFANQVLETLHDAKLRSISERERNAERQNALEERIIDDDSSKNHHERTPIDEIQHIDTVTEFHTFDTTPSTLLEIEDNTDWKPTHHHEENQVPNHKDEHLFTQSGSNMKNRKNRQNAYTKFPSKQNMRILKSRQKLPQTPVRNKPSHELTLPKESNGYSQPKPGDVIPLDEALHRKNLQYLKPPVIDTMDYGTPKPFHMRDENSSFKEYTVETDRKDLIEIEEPESTTVRISEHNFPLNSARRTQTEDPIEILKSQQKLDYTLPLTSMPTTTEYEVVKTTGEIDGTSLPIARKTFSTTETNVPTAQTDFTSFDVTEPIPSTTDLNIPTVTEFDRTTQVTLSTTAELRNSAEKPVVPESKDTEASLYDVDDSFDNERYDDDKNLTTKRNQTLKTRGASFPVSKLPVKPKYRPVNYSARPNLLVATGVNNGFLDVWDNAKPSQLINSQFTDYFQDTDNEETTRRETPPSYASRYFGNGWENLPVPQYKSSSPKPLDRPDFLTFSTSDDFSHSFFDFNKEDHTAENYQTELKAPKTYSGSKEKKYVPLYTRDYQRESRQKHAQKEEYLNQPPLYAPSLKEWSPDEDELKTYPERTTTSAIDQQDDKFWSWNDIEEQIKLQFPEFGTKWNGNR